MSEKSWASSEGVRKSMQANTGRDTKPELRLRRAVHARGLRYFVNRRPIRAVRRTADLVFPRVRVAVFLDGCFWHGCPDHHTVAKTNASFWADKVAGNRRRDVDTNARLEEAGWTVVRVWEHEPVESAASRIVEVVTRLR
jgi:DNA mismatch endonuclease, patch repair protein